MGENLAYVMYTSGSTGKPKGVAVCTPWRSSAGERNKLCGPRPEEMFLHFAPLSFDASTFEIWGAVNGGRLVVLTPRRRRLKNWAGIRAARMTTLWLTAGLFHLMVDETYRELERAAATTGRRRRAVVTIAKSVPRSWPKCRLINGYGPTENTTFTCCYPMQ